MVLWFLGFSYAWPQIGGTASNRISVAPYYAPIVNYYSHGLSGSAIFPVIVEHTGNCIWCDVFLFSLQVFSFLTRKNSATFISNLGTSSHKVVSSLFNHNLMQSRYITQNPQYKNCTKIRPVGAKLFKAVSHIYRTPVLAAFRNSTANKHMKFK
jgi:hypothetical protein